MSHVVMIARALLDPKTFDQVLTEDRLAELDGLIEDGTYVRGSRNLGWLADSVDSAGEYVDVPEDARDELPDMTRSLAHEDYECETSEYLSRITKTAMGLREPRFTSPIYLILTSFGRLAYPTTTDTRSDTGRTMPSC